MSAASSDLVHLIPLEMPYDSSPVNVYLVPDDPVTLVDTGPNVASSLDALIQGLRALGYRLQDIERIVVTHQHIDHFGLASVITERSGAEVCALDAVSPWIEDYPGHRATEFRFRQELMALHGVPPDLIEHATNLESRSEEWDPSVPVSRTLAEGDELEFANRSWSVLRRPGHSPFDTVFHDRSRGILFSGDHLISHISSNPLITPVNGESPAERPQAMRMYRESLRQTRAMDVMSVLSGHGGPIHDHRALIDQRFIGMERRRRFMAKTIAGGARTAHEIARSVWPDASREQPYLTLTEVLGHLDLLGEDGIVREEQDGSTVKVIPVSV